MLIDLALPGLPPPPAVDGPTLTGLSDQLGPDFVAELAVMFQIDAPDLLARARSAVATGDGRAVSAHLHQLKSPARMLGARRLGDLCEQLEARLDREPERGRTTDLAPVQVELGRVLAELRVLAPGLTAGAPV